MQKTLTIKQKQLLAEAMSNLGVAIITVGGVSPLFDFKVPVHVVFIQLISSAFVGILIIIMSLKIINR